MYRAGLIVAALVLATPAAAADLPAGPVAPVPAGYVPYQNYNWSSVYIGGNAGYGFATASVTDNFFPFFTSSENLNGFIGGGQIGANYQIGALVFGIEGDFDASNQSKTTTVGIVTETDKINWIGTVRGRVGAAYDRWFFYGTAGGGEGKFSANLSSPFGSLNVSQTHAVWAAGAGLEVGINDYLTARIEYLYFATGDMSSFGGFPITVNVQDNVIRGGLNLRLPY